MTAMSALVCAALLAAAPVRAAFAPDTTTVRLPTWQRVVLPNGMAVNVMPRRALPVVEIRLLVRGGATDDPPRQAGMANVVARLLTRGTTTRDAQRLADDLAEAGGTVDADVGGEDLTVSASVLAENTAIALAAVCEVTRHPRFAPRDVAAVLRDVRGDIAAERDDPSDLADRALGSVLFGASPYGHPVSGDEASLARIRRVDIQRWYAAHARPDGAALAIVGDVDTAAVWQQVRALFGDWRAPAIPRRRGTVAPPGAARAARITVIPREDVTQAQVRFAEIACGRDTPDYAALQVANALFSDGYTSRLVRDIRVAHGLTYGITSRFGTYRHTGFFAVSTSTQVGRLRELVDRTLSQSDSLVRTGPSDEEVARAKAYVLGQYPEGFQAPEDLAEQLIDQEFYPLPADAVERYAREVRAVTTADVRRVLARWVHPRRWQIVVVAPARAAQRALRGVAPLRIIPAP